MVEVGTLNLLKFLIRFMDALFDKNSCHYELPDFIVPSEVPILIRLNGFRVTSRYIFQHSLEIPPMFP